MKYTITFDVIMRGTYTTTVDANDEDTALDIATDNYNCAEMDDIDIDEEEVENLDIVKRS